MSRVFMLILLAFGLAGATLFTFLNISPAFSICVIAGKDREAVIILLQGVIIFAATLIVLEKIHDIIKSGVELKESVERSVAQKMYEAEQRDSKKAEKEGPVKAGASADTSDK